MHTLNCKGTLLDLSVPKVMGIINVTPDSFYDGGKTFNDRGLLQQTEKMLNAGAAIIDVGGYSSRPGADDISEETELQRSLPAIELILKNFPETIISVDTFRSKIANEAINAGASIVNDISSGILDPEMMPTVARLKVPYIMMHMKGTPQNMKSENNYSNLLKEILYFFSERISKARSLGINDIVIDPGFGFAKDISQNFELLHKLDNFSQFDLPILVGISRKSMIYKTLNIEAHEALNGTTVLNTVALLKGASLLRVHDVREAVECVKLYQNLKN